MEEAPLSQYKAKLKADRRPLIEQVNNQWRGEKINTPGEASGDHAPPGCCDLEEEGSCANVAHGLSTSRRFRRMLAYLLLFAIAAWWIWARWVQPRLDEEWAFKEGFIRQENGTYGIAKGGDTDSDLVRMRHLSEHLVPGGSGDPKGKRRLVFVGDVHGCRTELLELLKKVEFRQKSDQLVLVGDTISKGPDNIGVLDELIRLNAISVRGNHEDRVLHVAKSLESGFHHSTSSKGHAKDVALLKEMKPHHIKYLRDMPLMLHVPTLPMALPGTRKSHSPIAEPILVVHAGLVPGVRLDKQDPYFVMNMRSINRRTHVPSALRDGKNARPWYDVWAWYNDRLFRQKSLIGFRRIGERHEEKDSKDEGWLTSIWRGFFGEKKAKPKPQVVIYGHDSKVGLQINRWSKGLDSGCVSGGELTALVLDAKGRQELRSVGCKNYRG